MERKQSIFEKFASKATQATGSTIAFLLALISIVTWLITGPLFGYSDTWQLVINTGTTIITFLMVFLIQKTQNKDSLALHIKMNELVAANEASSNRVIAAEDLSEDELRVLEKYYCILVQMAKKDQKLSLSHSIEEAMDNHEDKMKKGSLQNNKQLNGKPGRKLNSTNSVKSSKKAT